MTWYPPTVTVAAASEPITAAEAKAQTRVDGADNDAEIALLIAAARSYVEDGCGTPLVQRTITVKCDSFADFAAFPVVPLQSVSAIAYVDGAGDAQTLSASVYEVRADGLTASIALKNGQSWPTIQTGSRITVTAVVGYSTIPDAIKWALLFLVAQGFDERAKAPEWLDGLLCNHRSFAGVA